MKEYAAPPKEKALNCTSLEAAMAPMFSGSTKTLINKQCSLYLYNVPTFHDFYDIHSESPAQVKKLSANVLKSINVICHQEIKA